jgi:hypothetical protein
MYHTIHDIGVASQIASYSDAIEVNPKLRWLLTSGTPGLGGTRLETCCPHVGASRYDSRRHSQGHPITNASRRYCCLWEGANAVPRRRPSCLNAPGDSPACPA